MASRSSSASATSPPSTPPTPPSTPPFLFAFLHHVPPWRDALVELARVLRPGGVLLVEEVGARLARATRLIGFDHPAEGMFTWEQFRAGLDAAGFERLEEAALPIPGMRSFLARRSTPTPALSPPGTPRGS